MPSYAQRLRGAFTAVRRGSQGHPLPRLALDGPRTQAAALAE
ncbi:hypothetical protein [Streptomyces sp. JJ66]|nr:hypothetical protein [Streptomyces sp. JJ66]